MEQASPQEPEPEPALALAWLVWRPALEVLLTHEERPGLGAEAYLGSGSPELRV